MNGDRPNEVPCNYQILPAGPVLPADDESRRDHKELRPERLNGTVDLLLVTVDPVHVGSGRPELLDMGDGPEIVRGITQRQDGGGWAVPVIPGSSLKGAVRSLCEALGGGCQLDARQCAPRCVTCGLFGHADDGGAFAARVGFDDAFPEASAGSDESVGLLRLPVAYQPRRSHGRRVYGPAPKGLKRETPYLCVVGGVRFRSRLWLRNVTRPELGLVALALGLDGSFHARVGGGKFAGLGRVRVSAQGALLRGDYRTPVPRPLDAEAAGALVAECLGVAALAPQGQAALAVLRQTLGAKR